VGVSFYAHIVEDYTKNGKKNGNMSSSSRTDNIQRNVQYYARIFVTVKGDQKSRFSRNFGSSESVSSSTVGGEKTFFENKQEGGSILLGETFIDIDRYEFENMSDVDIDKYDQPESRGIYI
jgi:hypothetical protein